jgi:peptidoglycan/LPS O-acetylase OafA/YrhL
MKNTLTVLAGMFLISAVAWAGPFDIPDKEVLSSVVEFLFNFKTWGLVLSGMALIVIIMNVLNKYVGEFPLKQVVAVLLGVAYGVFGLLAGGSSVGEAVFSALVSSGGAMKIYDAIKAYVEGKVA